jgi:hypothetical protein
MKTPVGMTNFSVVAYLDMGGSGWKESTNDNSEKSGSQLSPRALNRQDDKSQLA